MFCRQESVVAFCRPVGWGLWGHTVSVSAVMLWKGPCPTCGCWQVVIQLFRSGAVDQEWSRTGGRLLQCLAKPDDLDTGGTQVEREKHKTPMQVRTDLVS
ncbi:hypothetical protein G5714_000114 [Onychostoma macrolepis]|uniref:Uncharacterized protein n=1 Tax=Onychostoma macrolepis TaxID=369639 RepID=A0A7J6DFF4_9TELE|nr:hypothetical protein G5714_000114 [Onychostoma macrolepis]